ncbi:MAG: RHS repeat-associated core domain-containing protein [Gammaproteobacteria bacterium]
MRLTSFLFALLLIGAAAQAADTVPAEGVTPTQCGPSPSGAPCDGSGPASLGNTSDTNQGAGNPINVITGNKYQQEVDLPALPGVLGLEIVRHYNSSQSDPRTPPGITGRGWKLSYETDLYPIGNTLQIVQADGTRIIFIRDPKNPSQCATNNPAHGTLVIHKTPRGEEYVWTWTNGRTLSFNPQGKLTEIRAPTGEFVSLTRDTAGALVKVTDPQGRSLVLGYPQRRSPDRFNGVTHIDCPVGRFGYAYGSAVPTGHDSGSAPKGPPANPRDLLANLVRVDLPGAIRRHYHFEDPSHPTLLTGISVAGEGAAGQGSKPQRIATWAYDPQGRAILSVKGEPKRLGQDGKPVPGTGIEQVTLDFTTPGKTLLTNSLNQTTTYTHAIVGNEYRLLKVTGAGCASCGEANIQYGYDTLGRLTQTTKLSPTGQPLSTTRTERDAQGRPLRVSRVVYHNGKAQPARLQVRYEYAGHSTQPSLIARPSVIPGKEAVTRITYNDYGQPTQVTESGFSPLDDNGQANPTPITRTITYAYQSINGRSVLSQIDGPLPNGKTNSPADSDITRLEWDGRGDYPLGIIKPGNLASRVEARDEAGRPTAVREANGVLTQLQLTPTGQTARIERAGRVVSITYDARMQPISLTGNDGQTIRVAYLPGKLRYTLPDGQTGEETTNSEQQVTSTGWLDGQGRRLSEPSRLEYHPQTGQLAGVTLPSGLHTTFGYDAQGQPSHWQRGKAGGSQRFDPQTRLLEADVSGANYQMRADEHAASLALTLPTGAVHAERIDDFGRIVQQTSPERGTRTARYDAAGRTLEVRDAVRVMTARYDAAGRILERRHRNLTDGQERQVRYTWQGIQLIRIDDAEQITEYAYDDNARRISERVSLKPHDKGQADAVYLTRYRYDSLGRLNRTILPEGATLSPHYDAISRITRVDYQPPAHAWWVKAIRWVWADYGTQPLIADLASDSAHGVLGYTHANGQRVKTHHDRALRLTQRQDGALTTQLAYNTDDEIASVKRNSQTLELGYDLRGRLQQVIQDGTRRQDYRLDTNGNRLEQVNGGIQPYAYRPQSDQLLAEADRRYTYNAAGEPVLIDGNAQRRLTYDPLGQVAQVEDDGREVARYRYNQNRQRIAKTVNGQTTFYLWQGGAIAAEANAQGQIRTRYIYMGSRPVALIQYAGGNKPKLYAIHTDHLGTPLQVTDADRKIVWQAEYDIYGRASVRHHSLHSGASPPGGLIRTAHASTPASFSFNLRLPGQYEDAETGWHYNFHRYYNPETGRYLTPDPIGLEGGTNLYGYVDGNPAGASDPWGLYRLVMGFEVNHPAAFAGGIHNLNLDYGHTFFYLVDNDNKISSVFSFGPAEQMTEKGQLVGVKGTLNYPISEASKLFNIEINLVQYAAIKAKVTSFGFDVFMGKEKYWTALNNTCAESAMDILGSWYLGLGLPNGKSPVRVPINLETKTDGLGITNNGVTKIGFTNPYALFTQMVQGGNTYFDYLNPLGQLTVGATDPLVQEGWVK